MREKMALRLMVGVGIVCMVLFLISFININFNPNYSDDPEAVLDNLLPMVFFCAGFSSLYHSFKISRDASRKKRLIDAGICVMATVSSVEREFPLNMVECTWRDTEHGYEYKFYVETSDSVNVGSRVKVYVDRLNKIRYYHVDLSDTEG